jgi:hypothetical protein
VIKKLPASDDDDDEDEDGEEEEEEVDGHELSQGSFCFIFEYCSNFPDL